MSERPPWQQPTWPQNCPHPGDPAWPAGAIRWLCDHVPNNLWRHRSTSTHPWVFCATAAVVIRAERDALRDQYKMTTRTWATLLPSADAKRLIDDTIREGRRLSELLEQVVALEAAFAAEGMRGRSDVTPSP